MQEDPSLEAGKPVSKPQLWESKDGCMEAYVSAAAIAPSLKVDEAELLLLGDVWPKRRDAPLRSRAPRRETTCAFQ